MKMSSMSSGFWQRVWVNISALVIIGIFFKIFFFLPVSDSDLSSNPKVCPNSLSSSIAFNTDLETDLWQGRRNSVRPDCGLWWWVIPSECSLIQSFIRSKNVNQRKASWNYYRLVPAGNSAKWGRTENPRGLYLFANKNEKKNVKDGDFFLQFYNNSEAVFQV